jgi:hypothetical protein
MPPYEYKKQEDTRVNQQTTIDFESASALEQQGTTPDYFEERKMIADQYKVLNPEKIEKRDNVWYMVGSTQTVAEWDALQNTDDLPYYSGQR